MVGTIILPVSEAAKNSFELHRSEDHVKHASMKLIVFPLAAAGLLIASYPVCADSSGITVHVEQSNKTEPKQGDRFTATQSHSLKLTVSNTSPDPANIKAKYTYFGRDMKDHSIVSINQGEQAATVNSGTSATVEIPAASSTYSEEHYAIGARGKAGKKIDAVGAKFIGYAVQIFEGEKLVAEDYDPPSLKDEVGKAVGIPPPAAAPKK